LYESERTASDLLRKELQQLKQELTKVRSEVEVAKAVAAANETSSRRTDAALAVRIRLIFIYASVCFKYCSTKMKRFLLSSPCLPRQLLL